LKRSELLRKLAKLGVKFLKHSKKHDTYISYKTGIRQDVPRHAKIDEELAKAIIRAFS
jgi:hypothetical protein